MRRLIVSAFASLDGVIQAPGGPEEDPTGGFGFGGWATTLWDDTLGAAIDALFGRPFDLLLGRRTYEIFAAHWPHVVVDPEASDFDRLNADIARTFNAATKYVTTSAPERLGWVNSRALGPDPVPAVRALKAGDGPNLVTQGSSVLVQSLFAADLVDELRLMTFPIVLGRGKRLIGADAAPSAWRLAASSASPNGVILATYERAGPVETGSFAMETPTPEELARRQALAEEER